jgi:hypothetical protein
MVAVLVFPSPSLPIAVGALSGWMLMLAVKHVVADFLLRNSWMASGKDRKAGWALPLLVHCAIHGVLTTALLLIMAPRFWFIGLIDFAIHLCIDGAKGLCAATFNVVQGHPWFWWLIGIEQALHHLTGFFLSIYLAANG